MPGSRPDIRLTPEEQAEFLRRHRKAALATVDKDGFPHLVAMTYMEKDGALYMTSYAKAQKVVNIRRNPKIGIMVEAGASYAELRGVMVRGHCEIIEDRDAIEAIFVELAHDRAPSNARPEGAERSAPKRVVLKVVPEKTYTWDHTKLGGRY